MQTHSHAIITALAGALLAGISFAVSAEGAPAPIDMSLQGIQFWSMMNTGLSAAALVYLVKTEHRLTTLETQMEMHIAITRKAQP